MRKAISVTIDEDNWLWLKGLAAATPRGSLSAVVDRLVGDARKSGKEAMTAITSVAGTIDLPAGDPELDAASTYIKDLFDRSLRRPLLVKEDPPQPKRRRTTRRG